MVSGSEEEIFNRYATNQSKPKTMLKKRRSKTKKVVKSSKAKAASVHVIPARVYLFNFFLFSSFGSLMPFMPVFFKLLRLSSLENGFLYAVRPLISFWWGPVVASFATSSRLRQLLLFICVAGTIASTFCISIVRTNDGGILDDKSCYQRKEFAGTNSAHMFPDHTRVALNGSSLHQPSFYQHSDTRNSTSSYTWKTYIKETSQHIYHELRKGIVMKNMFLSLLLLTIISEMFMGPTLHISQAAIKFKSEQPLLNSLCLSRVFSKIGMTVAALSISYVAWKYRCIFKNVHYIYFHFYGFLTTGCLTAMMSLILPTESPQKTSCVFMICNSVLSIVFDWGNFGYIFGLWIAGIAEGTINAYILWFAFENGASELLIGILVSLALFTDMILHFTIGFSMKWIGHTGLLSVGIFLMSIQFFVLMNITNPLLIIPTQLLFGLASSCVRSSFIGCARSNGSRDMEKIFFFVFQAAYMGLGLGLGTVFISIPYYVFGAKKTFSALAILTGTYASLYLFIQLCICIRKPNRNERVAYRKLKTHDTNGDWLVDALEEEQDETLKKEADEDVLCMEEGDLSCSEQQMDPNNQVNNNQEGEVSHNNPTLT